MLHNDAMLGLLVVWYLALALSSGAEGAISCDSGCDEGSAGSEQVCTVKTVLEKPWPTTTKRTPPMIHSFNVSPYPVPDGYALNITWEQPWSDMEYVDGYYLTVQMVADDDQEKFEVRLNKGLLQRENKGFATFSYLCYGRSDDTWLFPGSFYYVKMQPIPLHNFEDEEHVIGRYVNVPREPAGGDSMYYPYQNDPNQSEHPDQDEQTQLHAKSPLMIETNPAIPGTPETATTRPKMKTDTTLNRRDAWSEPCVPLHMVIIACVLSVIGVIFAVVFFSFLYFLFCSSMSGKWLKRGRKGRGVKTVSEKYAEPQKPRILVVASMGQDDPMHKSSALCLAKALQDSGEFKVSCNLSMTQQIAKQGVALWANSAVESNDKIVVLCNATTESMLRKVPFREWCCSEDACCDVYPSTEIVLNLVSDPRKKAIKMVLVCLDDGYHACLANVPLPYPHKWEKFVLAKQFPQLAKYLLAGSKRRLKKATIAALQNRIEANINAIKEKRETGDVIEEGNNNGSPCLLAPRDVAIESEPLMRVDANDAARPNPSPSKPLLDNLHSPTHPQFRSVICNANSAIASRSVNGETAGIKPHCHYAIAPTIDYTAGARPKRSDKV